MWDIPSYRVSGKNKVHVAGFPMELCDRVIKTYSKEGDIVLDPFVGSGNSCLSAKKLNRNFIGFELSEKYYNTAKQRLELT
jgi:DNA modification methylase